MDGGAPDRLAPRDRRSDAAWAGKGFGVVYQAFDRARGAVVALKVLRRRDAGSWRRFRREFRALAELSHPNLQLYELFVDEEPWLFSMERIDG